MDLCEKFKLIRKESGLNQIKFGELISIPLDSLRKYEKGSREPSSGVFFKYTNQFPQYALWLTLNEVAPEVGQISPDTEMPQIMSMGVPVSLIDEAFDKTIETSVALGWLTPKEDIKMSMLADLHRHNFVEAGGVLLQQESTQEQEQEQTG